MQRKRKRRKAHYTEIDHYQVSPRVSIRPGDVVRFGGRGATYQGSRLPICGKFSVLRVLQTRGGKVFLDVFGLDKTGGFHTVYVDGKPYSRNCIRWYPYKVKKVRET